MKLLTWNSTGPTNLVNAIETGLLGDHDLCMFQEHWSTKDELLSRIQAGSLKGNGWVTTIVKPAVKANINGPGRASMGLLTLCRSTSRVLHTENPRFQASVSPLGNG